MAKTARMPHAPLRLCALLAALLCGACAMHRGAGARATPDITHGADIRHGQAVYEAQCAACHGAAGVAGPVGPTLRNERGHRSFDSVRAIVADPQPPMPKLFPARLTEQDVRDVSAYVETL